MTVGANGVSTVPLAQRKQRPHAARWQRGGGEGWGAGIDADGILFTRVSGFCIRRDTLAVSRCLHLRRARVDVHVQRKRERE